MRQERRHDVSAPRPSMALGDAEVEIISIDHAGVGDDARRFARDTGSWGLVLGSVGEDLSGAYRVDRTPTIIAVDRSGRMVARGSWRELRARLRSGAVFE